MSTLSNIKFGWDPAKNAANETKHGLSLAAAVTLWAGPVVTVPSRRPGEMRHLAIGLIEGKYWTVICAPRGDTLRLISARRSRTDEKILFQSLVP